MVPPVIPAVCRSRYAGPHESRHPLNDTDGSRRCGSETGGSDPKYSNGRRCLRRDDHVLRSYAHPLASGGDDDGRWYLLTILGLLQGIISTIPLPNRTFPGETKTPRGPIPPPSIHTTFADHRPYGRCDSDDYEHGLPHRDIPFRRLYRGPIT